MTETDTALKCVSCGADIPVDSPREWGGRCWRCDMNWLRTHVRRVLVRGREETYTLRHWDRYRCVFIHIPKTAGVSVSHALFGNGGNTHAPLAAVQRVVQEDEFDTYFKFTFVRNPWDRLVSAYEYLRVGVSPDEYDWAMSQKVNGFGSFHAFVRWLGHTGASEGMHFLPQHAHVRTKDSENGMDFVGRYETLEPDLAYVAERLGVQARLPHLNRSPGRRPYEEYYDAGTREIVGQVYRRDVELFGYVFGEARSGRRRQEPA